MASVEETELGPNLICVSSKPLLWYSESSDITFTVGIAEVSDIEFDTDLNPSVVLPMDVESSCDIMDFGSLAWWCDVFSAIVVFLSRGVDGLEGMESGFKGGIKFCSVPSAPEVYFVL